MNKTLNGLFVIFDMSHTTSKVDQSQKIHLTEKLYMYAVCLLLSECMECMHRTIYWLAMVNIQSVCVLLVYVRSLRILVKAYFSP